MCDAFRRFFSLCLFIFIRRFFLVEVSHNPSLTISEASFAMWSAFAHTRTGASMEVLRKAMVADTSDWGFAAIVPSIAEEDEDGTTPHRDIELMFVLGGQYTSPRRIPTLLILHLTILESINLSFRCRLALVFCQ